MKLNYKQILDTLMEIKERDDKVDDMFTGFIEAISPDHVPFFEFNGLSGFMKAIEVIDKQLADELSYFVYEVPNMKEGGYIKIEDKEYFIKTKEDMVKYLEETLTNK